MNMQQGSGSKPSSYSANAAVPLDSQVSRLCALLSVIERSPSECNSNNERSRMGTAWSQVQVVTHACGQVQPRSKTRNKIPPEPSLTRAEPRADSIRTTTELTPKDRSVHWEPLNAEVSYPSQHIPPLSIARPPDRLTDRPPPPALSCSLHALIGTTQTGS